MNKLRNKHGYTMTYAIIIIGLILILLGSLIMITYQNFRQARFGGEINTSFYAVDGAIEEALTELSRYTYNAEVAAWDAVNTIDYATAPWSDFLDAVYDDINSSLITQDQGNDIISHAIRGEFETAFFNSLLSSTDPFATTHLHFLSAASGTAKYPDFSGYTGVTFHSGLDLKTSIRTSLLSTTFNPTNIISASDVAGSPDPVEVTSLVINGPAVDDSFGVTIGSDGTYHDRNKKMEVDVSILPPNYNFSVSTLTESINLHKNRITDYPIAAKGSVIFANGSTTVTGDVYGHGDSIDFKYNQDRSTYGGIVLGQGTAATATINGDLGSRNAIKMDVSGSQLSVSNRVYANNLFVNPSANNVVVDVDDSIYLYSDLFIGGDNASIVIANNHPDASGTLRATSGVTTSNYIPANGNLFGMLSLHPVAEEDYTRTGSVIISETASNPSITLNGLFLNGIIRYDVLNQERFKAATSELEAYKTGESYTTYKNSEYYQTLSTSSIYQSGVIASLENFIKNSAVDPDEPSNIVQMVSFNAALDSSLNQSDFRAIHFFTMGYNAFLERNAVGASAPYSNKDISSEDKSVISLRNPVRDGTTFYGVNALGIVQFRSNEGGALDGKVYHPDIVDTLSFNNNRTTLFADMDEHANLLGYSDYRTLGSVGGGPVDVDLLGEWLNLSQPSVNAASTTAVNFSIYNTDASKDIYINFDTDQDMDTGDGLNASHHIQLTGNTTLTNELFEGTIVSQGNIYINADATETLTYNGNLISGKDIIFVGSGSKNVNQNDLIIYSAINKSTDLINLYHATVGRDRTLVGNMWNNSLTFTFGGNSNTVDVNIVNNLNAGGTTIVDSESLKINSWTETD